MQNIIKKVFLPITVLAILLVCGCAKYKPKPIPQISLDQEIKEEHNIVAAKKVLTEKESRKIFNRRLVKRGYQPVQIYIKNKSKKLYTLNSQDINLQLAPIEKVSRKLHRNPIIKGLKYFILIGPVWGAFEGFNSQNVNQKISTDLKERCLDDNKVINIKPNSILNTVVFVPTEQGAIKNFDIKLKSTEDNESLIFNV